MDFILKQATVYNEKNCMMPEKQAPRTESVYNFSSFLQGMLIICKKHNCMHNATAVKL